MNGEKHVTLWDKPQENPLPLKRTGGMCPTQPVLYKILNILVWNWVELTNYKITKNGIF